MANQRTKKWNGSKWVSRVMRLTLYLRDNLTCVYCGRGIVDNVLLSLDHIESVKECGENHSPDNLITCCRVCNGKRRNMSINEFVATYYPENAQNILDNIELLRNKDIQEYQIVAADMLKNGTYGQAIAKLQE